MEKFSSLTEQLDYLNDEQRGKAADILASAFQVRSFIYLSFSCSQGWLKSTGNAYELDRLVKAHLNSLRRVRSNQRK